MRICLSATLFGLMLAPGGQLSAFDWEMADPESLGWSPILLQEAEQSAAGLSTESVMIIDKSGKVVWQWGPVDRAHDIFSARKSIVSLLFGLAVADQQIDLDETLADLDINDRQGLTDLERQARISDLLKARSGVYHPAAWETSGMIANRPPRGAHRRGEHWYYNNWDFNVLNTIYREKTGQSVGQGLLQKLAQPLGFEDYTARHSFELLEDVSAHPSALLWISARDLGRLGLALINDGKFDGQQIVPAEWIRQSTAVSSEIGILGGYGYSWWVAREGQHFPFVTLPDGTYSARGTGEQILLVIPEYDTVIVHRGRVCGPGSEFMHVTDFGRLLARILKAKGIESPWPPPPPPPPTPGLAPGDQAR